MTKIDPTRENLETLIVDLIHIETENPSGNKQPGSGFVHDWFHDRNVDAELVDDPFEDRSQVVTGVENGDPTVILNGHIDVFLAGDRSHWTHDLYGAETVEVNSTVEGVSI